MIDGFQVIRRNIGHWDIVASGHGRLFRLRGGPGSWWVADERRVEARKNQAHFRDQSAAMSYICSELMHELIVAEGQEPKQIESWNVPGMETPSH